MRKEISFKNWEALSAYLDGELSEKERLKLENTFKEIPDLNFELEELKQVRDLIQNQPLIRSPRSFSLTQEMVGIRPLNRGVFNAYPILSSISVMASLLFVFVLIADLVVPKTGVSVQPAPLVYEAAPAEAQIQESLALESESSLIQPESSSASDEAVPSEDLAVGEEGLKMESSSEVQSEPLAKTVEEETVLRQAPNAGGEQSIVSDVFGYQPIIQANIRWLEISLLTLALLTGFGAYLFRRGNNRPNPRIRAPR